MTRRRRWRNKTTREIVDQITDAGGTIRTTASQHLRVTGPAGIALIGHDLTDRRTRLNAIRDLRVHAGIDLRRRTS